MNNLLNSVVDFIIKHKTLIIILAIIIIILSIGIKISPQNNYETFEDLNNILDKNIVLSTNVDDKLYYLGLVSKFDCINIKPENEDCFVNVVVLRRRDEPLSSNIFKLSLNPFTNKYLLSHAIEKYGKLNNLNQNHDDPEFKKVCFDKSSDEMISFDLEKIEDEYLIKFSNMQNNDNNDSAEENQIIETYYVSKCEDKLCELDNVKVKRLCLTKDVTQALKFKMDLAPDDFPTEPEISLDDLTVDVSDVNVSDVNTPSVNGETETMPNIYDQETKETMTNVTNMTGFNSSFNSCGISFDSIKTNKINEISGFEGFNKINNQYELL